MPPNDPGDDLRERCDALVSDPSLQPEYSRDGKPLRTFCNFGARRMAQASGCREFDGDMNADAMYAAMTANKTGKWEKVDGRAAALHAIDGGLVFACATSVSMRAAHGHIAVVRPEGTQKSATLGHDVPMVANIGVGDPSAPLIDTGKDMGIKTRRNWNCKVSQAFPCKKYGEPSYFIWRNT